MGVDLIVEDLSTVDDSLKAVYVEKEGKFYLDPEKFADSQVQGLKSKNGELLKKLNTATTASKAYERFKPLAEADEDDVNQFLEAWQKRGEGKPDSPDPKRTPQIDETLHKRELKKRDDELNTLKPEVDRLRTEVREFRLWTPLREIAIKAGLDEKNWELARLELAHQKRFDFDEDNKVVVMEDGSPSTVTPERFFKEVYSEQRPNLYKATGAGGSGATPGTKNGNQTKTMTRAAWEKLSPQESTAFFNSGGKLVD
jgi:hypothetical protein